MQTLVDLAKTLSQDNFAQFKARYDDIDAIYKSYESTIDDLIVLNSSLPKENRVNTAKYTKTFDELYYFVKEVATKNKPLLDPRSVDVAVTDQKPPSQVKLPKIDLPKFNGNLLTWRHFRDSFISLIHDNTSLDNIDKFNYLKSSLVGIASEAISAIPFDSNNYAQAWSSLLKQFDNERVLATVYLEHILEFSPTRVESLSELQRFLTIFRDNISALQGLAIPDLSQFILLHLGLKMLDSNTRYNFEREYSSEKYPTCQMLISFVEQKCKILQINAATCSASEIPTKSGVSSKPSVTPRLKVKSLVTMQTQKCPLCNQSHRLINCNKFLKLNPNQRFVQVKKLNLCFNCLSLEHRNSSCSSKQNCKTCNARHHSLLHFVKSHSDQRTSTNHCKSQQASLQTPDRSIDAPPLTSAEDSTVLQASTTASSTDVLLGTVQLLIRDAFGNKIPFRAILDSGSQRSFLTQSFVDRLGFQPLRSGILVTGIGSSPTIASKGTINTVIYPRLDQQFEMKFSAQVLPRLTNPIPHASLPSSIRRNFCLLDLADPSFDISGPVDGLLGNDIFVRALLQHQPHLNSSPAALSTVFGYVIMGPLPSSCTPSTTTNLGVLSLLAQEPIQPLPELSSVLKRFWDTEEPSTKVPNLPSDAICERHYSETHTRDSSGRYIVRLPFRDRSILPTNNHQLALNRWSSHERRFARDPDLATSYNTFLQEYLDLGHMKPCSEPSRYTIPHHAVFKPDSTTSKTRIVFDASAKQHNDLSLNECLLPGPVLQSSLADIICNFRLHPIALTADISKMYRQVLVHPDDQCFQHIVWRRSFDSPIETFALQTVTYGVISASFLAIRTLFQLVCDEGEKFPLASHALQEDTYVDDIVSGAHSEDEALKLQRELTDLCNAGGFVLQKWNSNSPSVVRAVTSQAQANVQFPLVSDFEGNHKILGIQWNPKLDAFSFTFNSIEPVLTKRGILSDIARLFDPLGWIAPVIFFAKCILQKLWRLQLTWDEPISKDLQHSWTTFISELPLLSNLLIPRQILLPKVESCHILGFSDASEAGYGCAIYVRTSDSSGNIRLRLLKARTKVAPIQSLTIPRLELCGALLLVRTLVALQKCYRRYPPHTFHLWTDSSIVLSWLSLEPCNLKIFVAHRIAEINLTFPRPYWGHVSTKENPADLASRGTRPSHLLNSDLWWNGPSWAYLPVKDWPGDCSSTPTEVPELKPASVLLGTSSCSSSERLLLLMERYSSLPRLVRVFAWVTRFIHNCKVKTVKFHGPLRLSELRAALLCCILVVQKARFHSEMIDVAANRPLRRSLQSLTPFIDPSGYLRVGGRLANSTLSWSAKHPLLLPKGTHLTTLIVRYYHVVYLHLGPQSLQSLLNRDYWIISGRSLIRKVVRDCPVCFRFRSVTQTPLMGELPNSRVISPGRAFAHVGLDFAGPMSIRSSRQRKAAISKAYICVFVCMATKALHIELVSSLSTEAFLACLDRFMSRRGAGHHFYSDQGKNFIGAARQLKEVREFLLSLQEPELETHWTDRNIVWHFNPPFSPNFGGLWEAAVKAIKTHLLRVTSSQAFTFEELVTILSKIEAILNSRPLCPLSSDPNDFDVLTPGHFLVGGPLVAIPEVPLADVSLNRLNRWQLIQRISQHFWKRWSTEYLHTLQQRQKWNKQSSSLQVGDLVLIKTPNSPALHWVTGRIIHTHPGPDNIVRVASVRTPSGVYKRPVTTLVPFPPNNN